MSEVLDNAPVFADGIDWHSFEARRRSKRRGIWFFSSAAMVLIIAAGIFGYQVLNNENSTSIEQPAIQSPNTTITDQAIEQIDKIDNVESENIASKTLEPIARFEKGAQSSYTKQSHVGNSNHTPEIQELVIQGQINQANQNVIDLRIQAKPTNFSYNLKPQKVQVVPTELPDFSDIYTPQPEIAVQKFDVDMSIAPSFVNPQFLIKSAGKLKIHKDYSEIRNGGESGAIGIGLNASIGKSFGRFYPHLGMGYNRTNVEANYNFLYSEYPIVELDGSILGYRSANTKSIAFKSRHFFDFVAIPLGLDIKLMSLGRTDIFVNQEFTPQFLLRVNGNTPNPVFLDEVVSLSNTTFLNSSLNYNVGVKIVTSINQKASWFISPMYSKSFGIQQSTGLYKTDLSTFTINFGWRKHLEL